MLAGEGGASCVVLEGCSLSTSISAQFLLGAEKWMALLITRIEVKLGRVPVIAPLNDTAGVGLDACRGSAH